MKEDEELEKNLKGFLVIVSFVVMLWPWTYLTHLLVQDGIKWWIWPYAATVMLLYPFSSIFLAVWIGKHIFED